MGISTSASKQDWSPSPGKQKSTFDSCYWQIFLAQYDWLANFEKMLWLCIVTCTDLMSACRLKHSAEGIKAGV